VQCKNVTGQVWTEGPGEDLRRCFVERSDVNAAYLFILGELTPEFERACSLSRGVSRRRRRAEAGGGRTALPEICHAPSAAPVVVGSAVMDTGLPLDLQYRPTKVAGRRRLVEASFEAPVARSRLAGRG
jgi:hypothetical protein